MPSFPSNGTIIVFISTWLSSIITRFVVAIIAKDGTHMETTTDLELIFSSLKELLQDYQPPLLAKIDDPGRYDLWSVKDVVIAGRKRKEVFFASAIIQKGYVGFYFMPIYGAPEMTEFFPAELLSLLKGKSCFHMKRLDDKLLEQVRTALQDGFALYKDRKWV